MKKFIISIDAGTTSNRSILFDLKGKQFFLHKRIYTVFSKSGWVEHNPEKFENNFKNFKRCYSKSKRLRGEI